MFLSSGDLASSYEYACLLSFLPSFLPSQPVLLSRQTVSRSLSLPPSYLRNPENEIFRAVFLPFAVPQILRAYASAYGHEVSSLGYSRPGEGKGEEQENRRATILDGWDSR